MAKKHVLSKEEIRRPDEISLILMRVWEWLKKYYKYLLMGFTTIALIAVVIAVVIYYRNARDARASVALWEGYQNWMRPLAADVTEEQVLPGQRQPVKDRRELLQTTYDIYSKGLRSCGNSDVCNLIHLVRGRVSFEMSLVMTDQRETHLNNALADLTKAKSVKGFLKSVVYDSMGQVQEELGRLDDALETYRQLATQAQGSVSGQAMIHQARILEMQGKKAEAVALYQEVVKSKTTGTLATQEAKLQQMIGLYQMMASMPQQEGNQEQQMQIMQALNNARLQLIRLQDSASVADPGHYAKMRLAFLDLGMDLHASAPKEMAPATDVPAPEVKPAPVAGMPAVVEAPTADATPAADAPAPAADAPAPAADAPAPAVDAPAPAVDAPAPATETPSQPATDMQ
ncbi:tetratricopeptide repeat protein [Myxococcota bacterium]|nr:tetratricopeptide repeat protein [Myxococcota bacterium]